MSAIRFLEATFDFVDIVSIIALFFYGTQKLWFKSATSDAALTIKTFKPHTKNNSYTLQADYHYEKPLVVLQIYLSYTRQECCHSQYDQP